MENFYRKLKPFDRFEELTNDQFYTEVPKDWLVVIADIKGSTKAISEGRYKEVNFVGAASVICLQNTLSDPDFPFVFGGDGATFLLPVSETELAKTELKKMMAFAKSEFQMELRVGMVPIQTLHALGKTLFVAKYELSPGNCLAQFMGSGLVEAEDLVKSSNSRAEILATTGQEDSPNLDGLSCRLKPISAVNGRIVSVLLKPIGATKEEQVHALRDFFEFKRQLLSTSQSDNPVQKESLKWPLFSRSFFLELKTMKHRVPSFLQKILALMNFLISNTLLKYKLNAGRFSAEKYRDELISNTDYQKFDEMLRMVMDCRQDQLESLVAKLESMRTSGQILFGIHTSNSALMTCMVKSAVDNQHIHFVDGSDGGYAMAAVQLKQQIRDCFSKSVNLRELKK